MLWTEQAMAQRLDWEKRNLAGKRKVSTRDEADLMTRDLAAQWLARAESRQQQQSKQNTQQMQRQQRPASGQLPRKLQRPATGQLKKQKAIRQERPAKRFKDLRPDDPRHQLAGVDMSKVPWDFP